MQCDRCYQPLELGEHGLGLCPLEPRQVSLVCISDSIPGGYVVEHGLCNPDGSARRYDSKSDMRREAQKRGLVHVVEHKGASAGSDKSPHTQRFL